MRRRWLSPLRAGCDSPSPLRLHQSKVPLLAPGPATRITVQAMDLRLCRGRTRSARGSRTIRPETCSSLPAQCDPILTATRSLFPARVSEQDQTSIVDTACGLPVIKRAASAHGNGIWSRSLPAERASDPLSTYPQFTRGALHVCTLPYGPSATVWKVTTTSARTDGLQSEGSPECSGQVVLALCEQAMAELRTLTIALLHVSLQLAWPCSGAPGQSGHRHEPRWTCQALLPALIPSDHGPRPRNTSSTSAQVELLQQQRRQTRLQRDVRNLIKRSRILAVRCWRSAVQGRRQRHGWPGQGTVKLSREEQQGQQRSEGPMLAWLSAYGAVSESMLVRASGCSCWSAVTSAAPRLHAEPNSDEYACMTYARTIPWPLLFAACLQVLED